MSKTRLGIIISSVRAGRVGGTVGHWAADVAREDDRFEIDVIDLAEVGLPLTTDEPFPPGTGKYTQDRTKAWAARIDACDAFVIVTPEYNHGYPASLKNALDLVYREWADKPVGFVSYGGISGGLRSVQQIKQVVLYLRMIPVVEAVVAPMVAGQIEDGTFKATEIQVKGMQDMLSELARVAAATSNIQR